jgi:hypothetical protein
VGYFGAKPLVDLAQRLEAMGHQGNLSEANVLYRELEQGISQLARVIAQFQKESCYESSAGG